MKYYHGTNYNAGLNIIRHGFCPANTIWTCSNKNHVYLISEEYDGGPYEENTTNPYDIPAFRFATGAAQIAAAHVNQLIDKLIVFEFDIPDDITLSPDSSCSNMYDCYEINKNDLNAYIRNGTISIKIYELHGAYEPYLRVFYLKDLDENFYTPCENNLNSIIANLKQVETSWFYDDYMSTFESYVILNKNMIGIIPEMDTGEPTYNIVLV